jgi:PKD repeat protein
MNPTKQQEAPGATRAWPAMAGLAATAALGVMLSAAAGGDMYHPPTINEGSIRAQATITSQTTVGTNTTLCWYGMQGWYSVEMSTNGGTTWVSVGRTAASDFAWCLTVNNGGNSGAVFRLNQNNAYAGAGGCAGCHGDKFTEWTGTKHSHAQADLHALGLPPAVEATCQVCHNVGKGQPTGFVDTTTTPQLTDVGCETCHGPAGWHKYSDHDLVRPAVSIDPMICGGCHQESHHPTYEEYSGSLHAQVNDDVKYGNNSGVYYPGTFVTPSNTWYGYYVTTNSNGTLKTNACSGIVNSLYGPANKPLYDQGQDRQVGCGMCHSGATRMAMLADYEARQANTIAPLSLPTANDSGSWGPTCAVCHDPHDDYNTAQLRNPTRSTNYFTLPTTADKRTVYTTNFMGAVTTNVVFYGTTFGSFYDPNIQVCGQCHNTRGARWDGLAFGLITNGTTISVGLTTNVTGYSRPPHHSPQYNILIGIVQPDYLNTNGLGVATNFLARHSGFSGSPYNTNQCATCHVPNYAINANTNVTGHTFDLDTKGCALGGCHLSGVPDIGSTQVNTTNNLTRIVNLLTQWATNKAPAILGSAYNTSKENSWEFSTVGGLASATVVGGVLVTNPGPSSGNQVKLPADIRQARFDAYMVLHDGSMGVHNPGYIRFLLTDAENKVLNQFDVAKFKANNPSVLTNTAVWFTNLNASATACTWDFGDGGTSTSLGPVSYTYSSVGTFTVKLTTTDPTGTQTMTRDNYIVTYPRPIPSFTANPASGPAPLLVSFANTSQNATYYRWTFMNGVTGSPFSNDPNPTFTYTNAGTYQVVLRAYNPGGNVQITNTVTAQ